MPSHANYVVPGCLNRKDHCKWGLSLSEDVRGRKRRLCGSTLDKVSCGNTSPSCQSVFHRLPKDMGVCAVLSKMWLAKMPKENTPLMPNSYIYGIHVPAGHPDEENGSPLIFLGKPAISKHYTHASTSGIINITTSMPKSHSAADSSSEEHMADVCRAMLTCHIDLESARNETIKELKSTIKERGKAIGELQTLLSESCAEVKRFLLPKFELPL